MKHIVINHFSSKINIYNSYCPNVEVYRWKLIKISINFMMFIQAGCNWQPKRPLVWHASCTPLVGTFVSPGLYKTFWALVCDKNLYNWPQFCGWKDFSGPFFAKVLYNRHAKLASSLLKAKIVFFHKKPFLQIF